MASTGATPGQAGQAAVDPENTAVVPVAAGGQEVTPAPEVTGTPGAEAGAAGQGGTGGAGGIPGIDAAVTAGQALVVFDGPGTGLLTIPGGQVVRVRQRPNLQVQVRNPSPVSAWLGGIPPAGTGQGQMVVVKAPPPGRGQAASALASPAALPPPPAPAAPQQAAAQAAPKAGGQAAAGQAATGQPDVKAPPPGHSFAAGQSPPHSAQSGPPPGQATTPPRATPPGQSTPPPTGQTTTPPTASPPGQAGGAPPVHRQAGGQGGGRARSRSAPHAHAATAVQSFGGKGGSGQGQGVGGGTGPGPRQGPISARTWAQTGHLELPLPGSAMWRQRQEEAGAPSQGYFVDLNFLESFLVDRSAAMGAPPHRGQALVANDLEPLVSGRLVYNLRDHIGQLQRELGQVDALLMAAFYGQARMPALRRALHTVSLLLRPVLQDIWVMFGTVFRLMVKFLE